MADITLTIGSTTYGLNLAEGANGKKLWHVYPSSQETNDPAKPMFEQTDWSGGFGQGDFIDANKYAAGQNIDTTQKGKFFLGPRVIANVTIANFVDGACALDGAAYTDESAEAVSITDDDITLLPATPAVNDAYYFGYATTFINVYVYISTSGAGTWTVTWEYWDGDSWEALSNVTDNTTSFTAAAGLKLVSFTLPADWATTDASGNLPSDIYWVRGRVSAYTSVTTQPKGRQAWVRSGTMPAPNNIQGFEIFGTGVYTWTTKGVFQLSFTDLAWFQRYETTDTINGLCVLGSYMFVPKTGAADYVYTTDGSTYTTSTLADPDATIFLTAKSGLGTTDILWKTDANNELKSHSTGINGTEEWTTANYIGDSNKVITGLFLGAGGQILAGKHDGLYRLDGDGKVHKLMHSSKGEGYSTPNFQEHTEYHAAVYFSIGSKLGEITSNSVFNLVGPYDTADESEVATPYVVSVVADETYLYCLAREGTSQIWFKGLVIDGKWSWCPWIYTASGTYTLKGGIIDDTTTTRKFWFGRSGIPCYAILTDDPIGDSNASFNTDGGYLETGWFDAGHRDWIKLLTHLLAECRGDTAANITVTLYYQTDETGGATPTWNALTAIAAATAGTRKQVSEVSGVTNIVSCNKVRFKIALATNDSTKTPVVKFFAAYGRIVPTHLDIYDFTVDVNVGGAKPKTIRDFLDGGRDSAALITLVDRFGTTKYITFLPGFPQEVEAEDEAGKQPTVDVRIVACEVDWS